MIGCDSERSAEVLREIYAPLTDGTYYERLMPFPGPTAPRFPLLSS